MGDSPGTGATRRDGKVEFLERQRREVEIALHRVSRAGVEGMPARLREPVEYALSTAGKRLRPILVVNAYMAAAGVPIAPPAVYGLSCAIEILHTYSLVHDDLPCMDDDDLRRGRPTVHRVFGTAWATMAGAALLPLAISVLDSESRDLGLGPEERARLVGELARAAGAEGMVAGQLLDLEGERREIGPQSLEDIHRRKTGCLLRGSLRIGALAGRAHPDLLAALTRYGEALGLAFQIADDLLDVEGDSARLGKIAGRDIVLNKASYPAVFGLDATRRMAREKAEEARCALDGYDLPDLAELADYVVDRRA